MVLPVLINWSMNIYGWQGALVAFGVLCLSSSIFGALMIPLNSIWNFLRNILSSFIIFWYIHAFVQNDFFYLSKISSVFKNFNYRKLFSQGFQNFLEHVLLRIIKLSPISVGHSVYDKFKEMNIVRGISNVKTFLSIKDQIDNFCHFKFPML